MSSNFTKRYSSSDIGTIIKSNVDDEVQQFQQIIRERKGIVVLFLYFNLEFFSR